MYRIVNKAILNASVTLMDIEAPFVARKAKAGQFIILRVDEEGERIPLTVDPTVLFDFFDQHIRQSPSKMLERVYHKVKKETS